MTSVLIALHEPFLRMGVEATLRDAEGFEVVGSVQGAQAVEAATAGHEPDLLLMDDRLRREAGGLLRGLAQKHPRCRVVVMVDHDDNDCTLRSLLLGPRDRWPEDDVLKQVQECCLLALRESARGCIPKSSTPEQLLSALKAISKGELWAGPGITGYLLDSLVPASAEKVPSSRVTTREIEVVGLVVDGLSNREIGERLTLSEQTVKNHVARIMSKLGVRNRVELALYAVREHLA